MEYLRLDLQLFAGEKTEKATPRRRQEARKRGQVFRSVDLSSAVIILAGFASLYLTFPAMLKAFSQFAVRYLVDRPLSEFTLAFVHTMLIDAVLLMAKVVLPVCASVLVAGLVVNLLQVGFVFSGETLGIKLERINPVEGFKRIFSKRALVELVKSVLKVIITGYVVYSVVRKNIHIFPGFIDMDLYYMIKVLLSIIMEMAMKVGVCLLILGILDYLYQWWEYERSLMMSKQEVKEEYKEIEGDPEIKAKQKQRQREMAMRRMMAEVPRADVVITNPTHFAVALKYEAERMSAPVVVAKGQDFLALRIKEIAQKNKVAVVENPELAKTLYYVVDIGEVIPPELYQAVAEVLAFVYRQRKVL